jgi:hypothetical protein
MYEPTVFADPAPCRGIRVAQAANIKFWVVNYYTFTGVATYLVDHSSGPFKSSMQIVRVFSGS